MPQAPRSIRARGHLLPMVGVAIVVLFTLGNAAANLLPSHRPTAQQLRDDELRATVSERRSRIAELQATRDRCTPAIAHELARLLVMDGRWSDAGTFANAYEQRCGSDPVVRHWGDAPRPRSRR